jgi:hypothetical protein
MSAAFPSRAPSNSSREPGWVGAVLVGLLWLLWQVVRIPTLAFLVILEPIVRVILAGAALLIVVMALFYRLIGMPHFPFWTMLSFGIGSALLLALYYALLRLFSGGRA